MEVINKKIDSVGDWLIAWATEGRQQANPFLEQGYPLADFRSAAYIVFAYLTFVFIGSRVMGRESAKPYGLYYAKFFYNILQVMLCSWMSIQALVIAYQNNYTLLPCNEFCGAKDRPISSCKSAADGLPPMGFVLYIFYLSKILDFADTIFIILSKNFRQLIFLHWYHHASIFLFYWYNLNVGYDGDVFLTIVLNGLIHAIMYTYYFVTMHTTKETKIWWKPALTMSQMVQFVCMNTQALYLIYSGCKKFPLNIVKAYLFYILSLLVLFGQFAMKEYLPAQYSALMKLFGVKVPKREKEEVSVLEEVDTTDASAVASAAKSPKDAKSPAKNKSQ